MEVTGSWSTDLAQLLKKDIDTNLGVQIGVISEVNPVFKIAIMGGEAMLRADIHEIYISNTAKKYHTHSPFDKGDTVLVIPGDKQNTFFITDTITRV